MIIDYDGKPQDSIFYTSALLYGHLKSAGFDYDEVYDYFLNEVSDNSLLFYYSLDWLYLLGKIRMEGGKVVCA